MPFSVTNDYLTGRKPVPTPADACLTAVRFTLNLAGIDIDNANDFGVIGILPAGYVPVGGIVIDAADLDSGTTLAYSVGVGNLKDQAADGSASPGTAADSVLSTHARDGGGAWVAGATVGQNAGAAVFYSRNALKVQPVSYDRDICIDLTGTGAGSGEIGITVTYQAA
jgi:hypothetical protein